MRKSLGSKRKELGEEGIATITRLFGNFAEAEIARIIDADGKEIGREVALVGEAPPAAPEGAKVRLVPLSRILPNDRFGFRQITVERPLRDEDGAIVLGQRRKAKGKSQPDSSLRDTGTVLLLEPTRHSQANDAAPACR